VGDAGRACGVGACPSCGLWRRGAAVGAGIGAVWRKVRLSVWKSGVCGAVGREGGGRLARARANDVPSLFRASVACDRRVEWAACVEGGGVWRGERESCGRPFVAVWQIRWPRAD
jgi:hypothetical protein